MNDVDKNEDKAFAARTVYRPKAVKGLQMGGTIARGALRATDAQQRTRHGLEASFTRGLFSARSELMVGEDGVVPRRGYYAQGGFRVVKPLELLFRTDVWDPDTRDDAKAATVAERDWLGGINWQVSGQTVLVQVNYVRKTFQQVQAPRNVILANIQTAW
jgi:phosphate-selective porin